jgi:uncharacterized protein
METAEHPTFTAFAGDMRIGSGTLAEMADLVKQKIKLGELRPLLIFDDQDSRQIDLDFRVDSTDALLTHLHIHDSERSLSPPSGGIAARRPGRPKLGVVAREVTLLPRHWDWLSEQPGGASVALRKLVEQARRTSSQSDQTRKARESAYRFMSAMAGNQPGFEEATRALFADDPVRFGQHVAGWPDDVRDHATKLGFSAARAMGASCSQDPGSAA